MTLISYAQNFEDVLLWRALGHIQNGFYIDVGANDPEEHSVTKAFYDAGWRGINIEPLPAFHQAFLAQRPRDTNLAIAAGAHEGSLTLYDVPSVNGWASPDAAVAEAHRAEGFTVAELTVPVRTLASVCAAEVSGEIHFLKIDVEGFEGEVLRGMDFGTWRPWILVIEATMPNSRVTNHETWEALVTGQRYRFAWFDGLNRYYVAEEHPELLAALTIQPNVFDDFISHHLDKAWRAGKAADEAAAVAVGAARDDARIAHERYVDAQQRIKLELAHRQTLEVELASLRETLGEVQFSAQQASAWAQDVEQRLIATHRSTSWRITRPLRAVGALARALRDGSLLRRVVGRLTRNERMRRLLIPLMLRFPALGGRVSQAVATIKQAPPPASAPGAVVLPDEVKALPESARPVLADLQRLRRPTGER
ncbi:MAG TPA: FkbM family methyltransferase [Telluria sp.]|nr:FkbM family methyltransferase [Telluria sp.]